jgi:hypothetical protein
MIIDPCNYSLKIWKSMGLWIQNGSSLGNVGVHFLTLSYIPRNMNYDSHASFLAHDFINPCLGSQTQG